MTQALFTAMTGLNAGTQQLTVVSDNVANMNTTSYKTSRVDFQDIWYQTRSGGTNSTQYSGGTNPYQVGVGVKSAAITKNMDAASVTTTGRSEDMAIQGDGWFTVVNSDGQVLFTRDGNFSLDEEGYIVTSNGAKVIGMDEMQATTCSNIPLKVPPAVSVNEFPTKTEANDGNFDSMTLGSLNNVNLVGGDLLYTYYEDTGATEQIEDPENPGTMIDVPIYALKEGKITLGSAANNWDISTLTVKDLVTKIDAEPGIKATIVDGGIHVESEVAGKAVKFIKETTDPNSSDRTTSNVASQLNLLEREFTAADSKNMNMSAIVTECVDVTADDAYIKKNWYVGADGLLTVTYSDGSQLSVKAGADDKTYFSYQDANGVVINSDPVTAKDKMSLYVDPNVLVKANMQVQLAKFVNNNGLVATGNNCYEKGVNAGDVIYTTANHNGVGAIATGALESSNVDLAQQFSNMILAQRLVQANSQVFSSANNILETLVYLGRG